MKLLHKFLFLVVMMVGLGFQAQATHYRAGEITFENKGNYLYVARCTTYAKWSSPSDLADKDTLTIDWGDGSIATIYRVNGPDVGFPAAPGPNGIPDGELLGNDIKMNIYVQEHQYAGAPPPPNRFYIVSVMDYNRMAGITNIQNGNSVNVPFFIEDTIKFPNNDASIGLNSSPILLSLPIDYANLNDTFYHNPNAYDPNLGDSLDFQLIAPLQYHDQAVPGYRYPDVVCPDRTFTLNNRTGEIIWATPCSTGIYNIAILIRDFRNGVNLSTMIRDMQIIVNAEPNDPPQIADVRDTCIRAGDALIVNVRATDPQAGQTVTLTATGGPFQQVNSPATFTSTPGNPATGTFNWNTICEHILGQDYQVVFKAQDNYQFGVTNVPLVDLETWQIKVIPPPVEGLTATATPSSVVLNWQNPYSCASFDDFRGFSVWRKVGCDSFVPNYCENDLSLRGYTKITGDNIFTYTYTDITTLVGQQYSYRIMAHFSKVTPNGLFFYSPIASVPSDEICVAMPISVPVMLNVDVTQTDAAAGQIFVRWSKPLAGGLNLDTVQFAPPYTFNLYRGTGFNFSNPTRINSFTAPSFTALNDTTFTDTNLNTEDNAYSYRVSFLSSPDSIGITAIASSVYLNVLSSDQSLNLTWSENVPWTNDSFTVYRRDNASMVYDSIGIAYTHVYADTGLANDSNYCYYVKAWGHYEVAALPRPLINRSQIDCAIPVDTVPPCPPLLAVRNECDQHNNMPWQTNDYTNYLHWSVLQQPCNDDITRYYIYYGADSASMVLVDSTIGKSDSSYNHILADNLAGCYAVTAVDRIGNESAYSNVVCIDNCPYYILPNTFTPNGDGQNDVFHPFLPYRFVPKIEMRIYNRWGEEVFRTEDPYIGWDGKDSKGKDVSEGVYVYAGYYYEQRLGGLVQKPLSGEKKGGGVIHLIRGK